MTVREYIGARYVPIFIGAWDNTKTYEPLSIVSYQGNSYTSRQYVPKGIAIDNGQYWALTGNYNAQIEAYREEVQDISSQLDTLTRDEIIVIGDSFSTYSYDNGIVDHGAELWTRFAWFTGMTVHNFAVGGSGFVYTGVTQTRFIDQFNQALNDNNINEDKLRAIIVFGGTNDYSNVDDSDLITALVNLNNAHNNGRFRTIPMYVIFNKAGNYLRRFAKIANMSLALQFSQYTGNVSVIDGSSFLLGFDATASDNVHPNDAGYAHLCQCMASIIMGVNPLGMRKANFANVISEDDASRVEIRAYDAYIENGCLKAHLLVKLKNGASFTNTVIPLCKFMKCGSANTDPGVSAAMWAPYAGSDDYNLKTNDIGISFPIGIDSTNTNNLTLGVNVTTATLARDYNLNVYIDLRL